MPNSSQFASAVAWMAFCSLVVGCNKVPMPSADGTAPLLSWHVENQSTGASTNIPGSGAVSAKPNETLRITLKADDPEGVKYIELSGGYTVDCRTGGAASNASGGYTTDKQTLGPDADGKVLTSIFLIKTITPDVTCPGGSTFVKTTVSLNGLGRNYFSGQTNETLIVNVSP
jgi:hypothetical protein